MKHYTSPEENPYQLYVTPYFVWGNQSGEGLATGFNWNAYGSDIGFQKRFFPTLTAGLYLDIHSADARCDAGGGDSQVKGMGISVYAGYAKSRWRMQSGARYSRDGNSAERPLWLTGATAKADYSTQSWAAWGEMAHEFSLAQGITFSLLANVNWVRVDSASALESGADLLNSYLDLACRNNLRHLLGAILATSSDIGLVKDSLLRLTVGWRHEHLDNRTQSSAELAGATRALNGPDSGRDALAFELEFSCPLPWGAKLELAYSGDYSQYAKGHSLMMSVMASF